MREQCFNVNMCMFFLKKKHIIKKQKANNVRLGHLFKIKAFDILYCKLVRRTFLFLIKIAIDLLMMKVLNILLALKDF